MKKSDIKIEKMLFSIYLDLAWSVDLAGDNVDDCKESLKDAKKSQTKSKRLLKKAIEKYTELTGKPPMSHKRK